jgi:enoyl-CoA hydratase/carnithine racemase
MEILITGDPISALEAYHIGLINQVVPKEDLMMAAEKMAARILANGPYAVRKVKESAIRGLSLSMPEALDLELEFAAEVFSTEDATEGPLAFLEKRQPEWKNK